ncbi:MAG: hypothetical protein O2798_11460 [Chloroflexi bacterium]|nr:hypothetical protein [Chloroflexota bacterium]MDA1241438.1 hypothetical protein [Chloroflexota bacterium]
MARLMLIAENTLPFEATQDLRDLGQSFASYLGEPVEFAWVRPDLAALARMSIEPQAGDDPIEVLEPLASKNVPMPAADIIYDQQGRPDWGAIWQGFCELALFGGPSHRGEDTAIRAVTNAEAASANPELDAIAEVRRGIFLTTGLFAEPSAEPGWLAVSCHSSRQAAWMCACIILENVEARLDADGRLLVPAHPSYTLKDEVKSVITVVAKVAHYWDQHALVAGIA